MTRMAIIAVDGAAPHCLAGAFDGMADDGADNGVVPTK